MDKHYVLYDTDIEAGCTVEPMSDKCVSDENVRLQKEGSVMRWIPYKEWEEASIKRSNRLQERCHTSIREAIARHSK